MAKLYRIAEGENLISEGEKTNSIYFVQKGLFGVFKKRGQKEIPIGQIQPGEIVGEMSFFEHIPRCATVLAMVDSEVLEIPAANFDKFFRSRPEWHQKMILTLLKRIRSVNTKLEEGGA